MGLAMRSAELAAEALDTAAHPDAEPDVAALRRTYRALWKTRSRACRVTGWAISSPTVAELAVQTAASSESLARLGMRLMGK